MWIRKVAVDPVVVFSHGPHTYVQDILSVPGSVGRQVHEIQKKKKKKKNYYWVIIIIIIIAASYILAVGSYAMMMMKTTAGICIS